MKIFTDFIVLTQTVKVLTLKYLSKHASNIRNAWSLQKFHLEIKKSGLIAKFLPSQYLGYIV